MPRFLSHFQGSEAIRYLEFCINELQNRDQAIHNYLLALYARLQKDKLMDYLILQGQEESMVSYDLKYALRLCSEVEESEACVHIYTTMGLYEEAVDLALKFDVQLAKKNADRPEDNEELRKKLWLKIAKHVVKEENDIKKAMEFLQECDLIKIEDILPFFPDFVTIDHFKDAICSSLDEYNTHIDSLKDEMEEATQSAGEIRTEIQTFRNKHTLVKAQEKCSACFFPVMTRAFYLFPCQHMFHMDCLIAEVITHLITNKRHRVEEIQRQLVAMTGRDDAASLSSVSGIPGVSTKERLKMELDDLIASECLYCGDIMIRSVDAPFIDPEEYTEALQGWE
ncbi:vacuolar protein sorting-associated protein 18 homolog [Limulus polyphemus]|uniref:Vacuolar protein sorting-associated protein 18 homolog n=1 Tax=Limulus polyphemus TaxID=6850 RepID=A0ABM1TM67_LIMPO|nr:vacuolar protein sorting-associated protein 18 homolog [Limulus polyphemus]